MIDRKSSIDKMLEKAHISKEVVTTLGVSVALSTMLFALNFVVFKPITEKIIFNLINIIALGILTIPIAFVQYTRYSEVKDAEERFPDFLRAITEGLHGGMTLPIAIKYSARSDYGSLTPHVKNLVAQISWGVPFDDAMRSFALKINSKLVERSTSAIVEAHNSGGDLASVINSIGTSFVEVDKLRKERESKISSQMFQGYLIYFIFIGIMIAMQKFLIPALSFTGTGSIGSVVGSSQNPIASLAGGRLFIHLAAIQGFFSGLSIGKLAEGRLSAGVKHSTILGLTGYAMMTLFG